jgi:hypothetical protein
LSYITLLDGEDNYILNKRKELDTAGIINSASYINALTELKHADDVPQMFGMVEYSPKSYLFRFNDCKILLYIFFPYLHPSIRDADQIY